MVGYSSIYIYIYNDILSRLLSDYKLQDSVEYLFVQVSIQEKYW